MINTRDIAAKYRLAHWAQVMQEHAQGGLSIKAYCKQLGICANTYFYRQWRVRAAAAVAGLGLQVCDEAQPPRVCYSKIRVSEGATYPAVEETGIPGQLHIEVGDVHLMVDSAYPVVRLAELTLAIL